MIRHTLIILVMTVLVACGSDNEEATLTHVSYYSCENDAVIRISIESGMLSTSLFRSKELVATRQLKLDADKDGRYYHAGDMSLRYDGQNVNLKYKDNTYASCVESPEELERRELATTRYFVTNTGELITVVSKDSGIVLQLKSGEYNIYSGSLPRVVSASGEKYEDGNTMFWAKGNTAMFVNEGVMYGHCVRMWEEEIVADACPPGKLRNGIDSMLRMRLGDAIASIPSEDRKYTYDVVDLNDDGIEEIFVAFNSPYFCGSGGCSWLLLDHQYSLITTGTVSDFPFYISNTTTSGYKDLYVQSGGAFHVLKYDGQNYPGNPSIQEEIQLFSDPLYTTAGVMRVLEQAYLKHCEF